MIGLKIRYKRPTPKMYTRALRETTRMGPPHYPQSRESLRARHEVQRERRQAIQQNNAIKQQVRLAQADKLVQESGPMNVPFAVAAVIIMIVLVPISAQFGWWGLVAFPTLFTLILILFSVIQEAVK